MYKYDKMEQFVDWLCEKDVEFPYSFKVKIPRVEIPKGRLFNLKRKGGNHGQVIKK